MNMCTISVSVLIYFIYLYDCDTRTGNIICPDYTLQFCPSLSLSTTSAHPASIHPTQSKWSRRQTPEINICFIRASLLLPAAVPRGWWMESSQDEAPCQFSTRWRELGKGRMRDEWAPKDSEGDVVQCQRGRSPDAAEYIKIHDWMSG